MSDIKVRQYWIDDVTQRVCAPWGHPELGAHTLNWPDNQKVIRAIEAAPVLNLLREMGEALKESKYLIADQTARANKAIATDCTQCDYQCEGCIHSIDDCDRLRPQVLSALEKLNTFLASIDKGDGK